MFTHSEKVDDGSTTNDDSENSAASRRKKIFEENGLKKVKLKWDNVNIF